MCRRGDALYAQRNFGETMRAYDLALTVNADCSYAYNGVALLRDQISELECREEVKELARRETVISLYVKALSLDMRNSYAAVNLGMCLMDPERYFSSRLPKFLVRQLYVDFFNNSATNPLVDFWHLPCRQVTRKEQNEIHSLIQSVQQEQPTCGYGMRASARLDRVSADFPRYLKVEGFDAVTPAHLAIKLLIISLKINPKLFYARTALAEMFFREGRMDLALIVMRDVERERRTY